ncbi:MAG: hypothetical protein Q8L11_03110 [Candidatus Moranbacteria bacterium]|nr:hypothetical protein [Candidatus Moranbacteria bacterium]
MELKKWPKTEMGYWRTIEMLEHRIQLDVRDFEDGSRKRTPENEKNLADAREIMEKIISELSKFGVIHSKDSQKKGAVNKSSPEGRMYYQDWCLKMRLEFYSREYRGLLCSACILSDGLDKMVISGAVPCSVWQAYEFYRLVPPYQCIMTGKNAEWTEDELFAAIQKKGGNEAVIRFKKKLEQLKA